MDSLADAEAVAFIGEQMGAAGGGMAKNGRLMKGMRKIKSQK